MTAFVAEWSVVPSEGIVAAASCGSASAMSGSSRTSSCSRGDGSLLRVSAARRRPRHRDSDRGAVLVAPGQTRTATFRVTSGSYVLLDNLPWHYWQGAWAAFAVR